MLGKHSGHQGTKKEDVIEGEVRNIDNFITMTESQRIAEFKKYLCKVETQVNSNIKALETGVNEANEHENHLIELVKKNTKETVTQLESEIKNIIRQFYQFKTESENILAKLEAADYECKQTKQSTNDEVQELNEIKQKYQIIDTRKCFNPGPNAADLIKKAFGYIQQEGDTRDTPGQSNDASSLLTPGDSINKYEEGEERCQATKSKTKVSDTEKNQVKNKELNSHPSVTKSVILDCRPSSIKILNNGTICICIYGKYYMKLFTTNGDIKQVDLDIAIYDIDIHPTNDDIYATTGSYHLSIMNSVDLIKKAFGYFTKGIVKVNIHTGRTYLVFKTEHDPECLAFGKDNTLLVGFSRQRKVIMYTDKGDIVQTICINDYKLYNYHITVSPITGDVAITRCFYITSVFNKDLQLIYEYQTHDKFGTFVRYLFESFSSIDVYDHYAVYDHEGYLFRGDTFKRSVDICAAQTGELLKTINLRDYGAIQSLAIQSNDTLVVGTGCGNEPHHLVFVKYI